MRNMLRRKCGKHAAGGFRQRRVDSLLPLAGLTAPCLLSPCLLSPRLLSPCLLSLCLLSLCLLSGCPAAGVGDPCLPEKVPPGGFNDNEAYIETSSVQCQTRVCIVYRLKGDPRIPESQMGPRAQEVANRVYCTCRCNAGPQGKRFATCNCPSEYECIPVLELGGPGIRGSYCVKKAGSG